MTLLKRTLQLLESFAPGSYLVDGVESYDDDELQQLAVLLKRLIYSPSNLRRRLQDLGITVCPANFYSEIPTIREIENADGKLDNAYAYIFLNSDLRSHLMELLPYAAEFEPPRESDPNFGFAWLGGPFSYSDAMAYYSFIRQTKPQTIIEVGSGWSTLIADAAIKRNGFGRVICVEPYPPEFLHSIGSVVELVQKPVQDIGPDFFNERLVDGDILFIDSTHTVKHGSDCLHLYLTILPNIQSNILVHAHDIHLPGAQPTAFLRDRQVYWTEQYLLCAYLIDNSRTRVVYGSAYHLLHNRPLLIDFMHGRYPEGGASLWFTQAAKR